MLFLSNIANSSYSQKELKRCLRKEDFWKYEISEDVDGEIEEISRNFHELEFKVLGIKKSTISGRTIFFPQTLHDAVCLRRTNEILKSTLRHTTNSRNDEVRQLKHIIRNMEGCKILKTDVASLFENIPFKEIIRKLANGGLRHNLTLNHLRQLSTLMIKNFSYYGLPPGLGLSSTLADFAFSLFDSSTINHPDVEYYTRYVDDLCILHHGESSSIEKHLTATLPFKLQLNRKKTKRYEYPSQSSLDFLGYSISLSNNDLATKISPKKLGRAKTRIVLCLKSYLAKQDFPLLLNRIRFLSSSVKMKISTREAPVFSGHRHVYRLCNTQLLEDQMKELDIFFHGLLSSNRYSLSRNLRHNMSEEQRAELKRMSFRSSVNKHKFTHKMKNFLIGKIRKAWQYE